MNEARIPEDLEKWPLYQAMSAWCDKLVVLASQDDSPPVRLIRENMIGHTLHGLGTLSELVHTPREGRELTYYDFRSLMRMLGVVEMGCQTAARVGTPKYRIDWAATAWDVRSLRQQLKPYLERFAPEPDGCEEETESNHAVAH